jgi:hypothetical protein
VAAERGDDLDGYLDEVPAAPTPQGRSLAVNRALAMY